MTNFKSGSGNLDFGDDDGTDQVSEEPVAAAEQSPPEAERTSDTDDEEERSTGHTAAGESGDTYPYFVRRSNVGDERDTRLEIHVRDKVADREAQFRHALAERLGASDVSKTDAREFALLAAFENPDTVARLMREEGFDTLG